VAERGHCWLGYDMASQSDEMLFRHRTPKVVRRAVGNNVMLVGHAGSAAIGQAVHLHWQPPPYADGTDALAFVDGCARSLHAVLTNVPVPRSVIENDLVDGEFLVGWQGRLWSIDEGMAAFEVAEPYYAIGAGTQVARGSLATSACFGATPEERVRLALHAAHEVMAFVGPPGPVLSTSGG
jgi:hypothetical protein